MFLKYVIRYPLVVIVTILLLVWSVIKLLWVGFFPSKDEKGESLQEKQLEDILNNTGVKFIFLFHWAEHGW